MKTIQLSDMTYRAHSPSLFELVLAGYDSPPANIAYDGTSWLIAVHGIYGTKEYKTRDDAASFIGQIFLYYVKEQA